MVEIILVKGMQASGKTSWAKEYCKENPRYKRISRDDFRHMIGDYNDFSKERENVITSLIEQAIFLLLEQNYNLIIDEMHLNIEQTQKQTNYIKDVSEQLHIQCQITIKEFPVTLGEAIQRDANRDFPIGSNVLKRTWDKYEVELKQMIERTKPKHLEHNSSLPKCIICDIDGTLALSPNRKIFDESLVYTDYLVKPVKLILDGFNQLRGPEDKLFVFSGRTDSSLDVTTEWLKNNGVNFDFLIMRKTGDYRCDTIVKREMFEEHVKSKYEVLYVVDDRPKVLEMWTQLGLFTLNVNQDPYCKNNF